MNAIIMCLLPENHTDNVQPINAGIGKLFKTKIGEALDSWPWLEDHDHLHLWHDKISDARLRLTGFTDLDLDLCYSNTLCERIFHVCVGLTSRVKQSLGVSPMNRSYMLVLTVSL